MKQIKYTFPVVLDGTERSLLPMRRRVSNLIWRETKSQLRQT